MLRVFTSSLLGEAGHGDGRHILALSERLSVEPEVTFVQGRGIEGPYPVTTASYYRLSLVFPSSRRYFHTGFGGNLQETHKAA